MEFTILTLTMMEIILKKMILKIGKTADSIQIGETVIIRKSGFTLFAGYNN